MENEDIEKLIAERQKAENKVDSEPKVQEVQNVIATTEEKSLSDLKVEDIKVTLDKNKNYEEQAETIAGAMSVVGALNDDETRQDLIDKKGEELKAKAESKVNTAKAQAKEAETKEQKAERTLYEAVLETFGIYKHLPRWLMKIVVGLLTPFYLLLVIIIGIPTGAVKFLVDCLDGIFVRYEAIEQQTKPRVKVITWVTVSIAVVTGICLTVLAILHII